MTAHPKTSVPRPEYSAALGTTLLNARAINCEGHNMLLPSTEKKAFSCLLLSQRKKKFSLACSVEAYELSTT
jgi:hypothetical protein